MRCYLHNSAKVTCLSGAAPNVRLPVLGFSSLLDPGPILAATLPRLAVVCEREHRRQRQAQDLRLTRQHSAYIYRYLCQQTRGLRRAGLGIGKPWLLFELFKDHTRQCRHCAEVAPATCPGCSGKEGTRGRWQGSYGGLTTLTDIAGWDLIAYSVLNMLQAGRDTVSPSPVSSTGRNKMTITQTTSVLSFLV